LVDQTLIYFIDKYIVFHDGTSTKSLKG